MSRHRGSQAETQALDYLCKAGLVLLARNFYTTFTELDLIMQDKEVIVGVEVKYRMSLAYGHPAEAVSRQKLRRLRLGLTEFLLRKGFHPNQAPHRIDVVAITPDTLEWLPNITE